MKNSYSTPLVDGIGRREALGFTLLCGALGLAGCGGGSGSVAGVNSGGTGSFSIGPITGFGSIIVGAIRFDESKARRQPSHQPLAASMRQTLVQGLATGASADGFSGCLK